MIRRMLALMAALFAGATTAHAASASFGVNGTSSILLAPNVPARRAAIKDIAALGGRYVRIDVTWSFIEPMPGLFSWLYYDGVIADIRAAKLEPILLLDYANPAYGALVPEYFARYAAAVAARYGPKGCHTYEVWNEPNIAAHYLSPAEYVTLLAPTFDAIHAADQKATVLGGSLGPSGMTSYAQALYEAGIKGHMDALSIHPYVGEGADSMNDVRAIMVANGDGAKKMWATEFGWSSWDTPGNSEALQASRFTQMGGWWKAQDGHGPLIAYTHRDTTAPGAEGKFGLTRPDGSRKPAWTAFRDLIRAG